MKLFLIISIIFLLSCGSDNNSNSPGAFSGVHVDSTTIDLLGTLFDVTEQCTGIRSGRFENLTIVLMPHSFPCEAIKTGPCGGQFTPPNTVQIGSYQVFRHEVIHYLLYINTGNLDPGHMSDLFRKCG